MTERSNDLVDRAKGFVAGTVSGLTKLAVGHPFVLKVRMQCSPPGTYKGVIDCVGGIVRNESILGVYKGCTPPAIGWMFTDAVLLGSLHTYRSLLTKHVVKREGSLPIAYQSLAGLGAGWTNSFVTAPVELLKAKLQMQKQRVRLLHAAGGPKPEFSGAWDCFRQVIRTGGITGLWHALPATLWFRSSFAFMFGSYDVLQRHIGQWAAARRDNAPAWIAWALSPSSVTFISGGLAAEIFWATAYPADVVKNRMMADSIHAPRYPGAWSGLVKATRELWSPENQSPRERGILGFPLRVRRIYTGFLPCALRAFPTNAAALLAFETAMYLMGTRGVHG
ncbi:hypothetical protein MCUN1_000627 [Malassezia cuniculi]|uniref:Uncharacterized protein n=1 Tax=Malassezia cuniculi TaxID=948313 RepID=A0AAF0J4U6_9BASI|nr:hypothetical protein MCUN1_000627 [Malassezia cuniculi]